MAYKPGVVARAWFKWKSLPLFWRKSFFKGFDLSGNKYYESVNPLHPGKMRRTVKYFKDGHYVDNSVTPQWMSWMRHTRRDPPTMAELKEEVDRIQRTVFNAKLLNAKWQEERSRSKLVSSETEANSSGELHRRLEETQGQVSQAADLRSQTRESTPRQPIPEEADRLDAPGVKDAQGNWQPEQWTPRPAIRRR